MTSRDELETALVAAWDRLKAARACGDDLAAELAQDELDALLDDLGELGPAPAAVAA